MLFGRTETPKGIGTVCGVLIPPFFLFGRTETPKGIGTIRPALFPFSVLFGRTETPKGIGTYSHTIPPSRKSSLEEQKPQRGLELIRNEQ